MNAGRHESLQPQGLSITSLLLLMHRLARARQIRQSTCPLRLHHRSLSLGVEVVWLGLAPRFLPPLPARPACLHPPHPPDMPPAAFLAEAKRLRDKAWLLESDPNRRPPPPPATAPAGLREFYDSLVSYQDRRVAALKALAVRMEQYAELGVETDEDDDEYDDEDDEEDEYA